MSPAAIELRPYQEEAVSALFSAWQEAQGALLVHATGLGKTTVACEVMRRWIEDKPRDRILFLAHRDELIQQAHRRIESMLGIWADIDQAETRDERQSSIVIGSVQTCYQPGRLSRFKPDKFGLIVVDECFPAGTMIGNVPIERVRVGDTVNSYDEATGAMVERPVRRLFVSRPSGLVRVTTSAGDVVCTPSHPFLTPGGWLPASALHHGGMVLYTTHGDRENDLRSVRLRDGQADEASFDPYFLRRRAVPRRTQGARREEGRAPRVVRVDRVEPGRDGTFGEMCPDGLVYNLEVEGTHTYTANGFVVHNCHHAASSSYLKILDHFPGAKRLGLTATPTRQDGKKLGQEWDTIAHEYNIRHAIADGWLAPIRRCEVKVSSLELDGVATQGGDLVASQVEERVLKEEATVHAWARGILDSAPDRRKVLAFCPGVESSKRLVECLNRYAPDGDGEWAAHIDGETPRNDRRHALLLFARGELRFISNCGVLLEGYDEPGVDCIAMCRPTKSEVLYAQAIGRGTRTAEGKKDLLVIDFTSNSRRLDLVTAIDILAGDESEAIRTDAKRFLKDHPALTIDQAVERALHWAESRKRKEEEDDALRRAQTERKGIRARAQVVLFDINDPDAFLGINKYRVSAIALRYGAKPITPKQRAWLERTGFTVDDESDVGLALARSRLNKLAERAAQNLCSFKQAKILAKNGLPTDLTFEAARMAIDGIAAAGWRPSIAELDRIRERIGLREAGMEG